MTEDDCLRAYTMLTAKTITDEDLQRLRRQGGVEICEICEICDDAAFAYNATSRQAAADIINARAMAAASASIERVTAERDQAISEHMNIRREVAHATGGKIQLAAALIHASRELREEAERRTRAREHERAAELRRMATAWIEMASPSKESAP